MTPAVASRRHDLADWDDATDLDDLIQNMQTLLRLARPLVQLIQRVDSVRRWEPWAVCAALLVITNSACLIFEEMYIIFLLLLLLSIAGLGYLHRRTNILVKVIPSAECDSLLRGLTDSTQSADLSAPKDIAQSELLDEFRYLLCFMNAITRNLSQAILKLYSILKWENLQQTLTCYLCVTLLLLICHVMPTRLSVTLVVDLFLLHYPLIQYFTVVRGLRDSTLLHHSPSADVTMTTPYTDDVSYEFSDVDPSYTVSYGEGMEDGQMGETGGREQEGGPDSAEEKYEADSSSDDPSDARSPPDNVSLASDTGSVGKGGKRPGVVGKILKTVKNTASSAGSCSGCSVNFTTILKRRRLCSHCGNHFCARCCSYKVTRSMFGATAPAAQTETVNVCFYCFNYLNKIYHSKGGSKTNLNSLGTASAGGGKQNGGSSNGTRRTKSDGSEILCENNKEKLQ